MASTDRDPANLTLQLIPTEVTEQILTFCHVRDVASVAQTCQLFRFLIYDTDQYLWRELFLAYPFDDLRISVPAPEDDVDWRSELQRRVFAETIMLSGMARAEELHGALETLVSVADRALPYQTVSSKISPIPSDNLTWLCNVLQRSSVIHSTLGGDEQQLCCKLRSYLALTLDDNNSEESVNRLRALRSISRCAVYDLRKYMAANLWGPYMPARSKKAHVNAQPKVNWEHVEHIMNVVVMNMRDLEDTPYTLMRPQLGLEMTRAYSAPGTADLKNRDAMDWAGVGGLWRRFVCFMDYRELFAFNFSSLSGSLTPSYFNAPHFNEAVRLLEMCLSLVKVDEHTAYDYPDCPQLHFDGYVRGLQTRNAEVKGVIQRFLDGTIRWKFHTIYDGQPQWSGECIQIGNICSAAGLVGIWSGVDHAAGDPAGPFLMWKVAEPTWIDKR